MSRLRYVNPPPHACDLPSVAHLLWYTEHDRRVLVRWTCRECTSHWAYVGLEYGQTQWVRTIGPSWRWKRQERRRLASLEGQS